MIGTKRKADGKVPSSQKRHEPSAERATKRQRQETPSNLSAKGPKPPLSVKEKKSKTSVLQQEERTFPRGGGGVLTPLEQKQIQIQATRDVLFEESGQKKTTALIDLDGEEIVDDEGDEADKTSKKRKKGKPTKTLSSKLEPATRVEGLKFKRLSPGSLVLGQVTRITSQDVTLDLPNNLTGVVPITGISTIVTKKLETIVNAENENAEDDEEGEDSSEVHPKLYLRVGQFLRAFVVSTSDESSRSGKSRKRIELSLHPSQSNGSLSNPDICLNCMVQACVISSEDRGYVMDLGMKDGTLTGFLARSELPPEVDASSVREGSIFLCLVTRFDTKSRVVGLTADHRKAAVANKTLQNAPTVNSFIPGAAVELLVSQVSGTNILGKVSGLVNATADIVHSGAGARNMDIESKYKVGTKVRARIIFTLEESEIRSIGVSILDHVLSFAPKSLPPGTAAAPRAGSVEIGKIVEQAKIVNVEPGLGLFVDVGEKGSAGFVHISRVSDGRVELLSPTTGPYRSGTSHRARIIGFNAMDSLYLVSLEKSVLEQTYLRIEDVPVGEVVKARVEKLTLGATGVTGILLNLAQGITGFVPEKHMADIQLQHPERKFKEGVSVTARVLSVDLEKRQIRLTLKKSLVNTDLIMWSSYEQVRIGAESLGTIAKLTAQGAVVRFLGSVRSFLPVKEMSDAYIQDATTHFRVGQVVRVHAMTVDAVERRMTVSCRLPGAAAAAQSSVLAKVKPGDIVSGTITGKSDTELTIELKDIGLIATLRPGQLTDGSEKKNTSAMKRMRIGQSLTDLVVLDVFEKKASISLTQKPSLVRSAQSGDFITRFEDVVLDKEVNGFVRNITADAVFVEFGAAVTGLLHKSQVSEELSHLPEFGLVKDQSISCRISSINPIQHRFGLTMKDPSSEISIEKKEHSDLVERLTNQDLINPVDKSLHTLSELQVGKIVDVQITSVKDTQLNVKLADHVQGRIDVSEVFNTWDDIKDRKNPLRSFRISQIIPVKILGLHDARSHRFLPISHRIGKVPVYELTAKIGQAESVSSLSQVQLDSWYTGFVNSTSEMFLWVNLSPNVRGRVDRLNISEDVSALNDLSGSFPIGSAIRVRATAVDPVGGRLDLSAKPAVSDTPLVFEDVSPGMIIPGRVTKVTERGVVVQLSGTVVGHIGLPELADDFSQADPTAHAKNEIVRVCVLDVDKSNKRLVLSSRPSKVLSSSLSVKDPLYTDPDQLKVGNVVGGFIKNVTDIGVFMSLSYNVTAFARVSELTDDYVKDWKNNFEINRLVFGKVIAIDPSSKHIQLSLKPSVVSNDYIPRTSFSDLRVGDVITGTVRKVEEFGAFVVVDNSHNVSGLAHRSEMAEQRIEDARALYNEGDAVKAIVLKIEPDKRRVAFGLKASYFAEDSEDEGHVDEDGVALEAFSEVSEEDVQSEEGIHLDSTQLQDIPSANLQVASDDTAIPDAAGDDGTDGLDIGGFDWIGSARQQDTASGNGDLFENSEPETTNKKKKRKPLIKVDMTGDLDKHGPQTADDFERMLLSQPNDSSLWVQYMAFHLQLSDIDEARKVAERATKTINMREQDEKMNVWIAWLNLENAYGNEETLEKVFGDACAVSDSQQIHERLTSIYIQSGKTQAAEELFRTMTKKKAFTTSPKLWLNYATFLFDTQRQSASARALLDRAMQSVPSHLHRDLVVSFASLEFKCKHGDAERGRTMFEKLHDTYPKRWDVWDIHVELEEKRGEIENVRALFERMAGMGMKKRRANALFKRWLAFEDENGMERQQDHVKAKAMEWIEKHKGQADD